ncbi:MAG: flavin monoamine oxidase family protein, partial [Saprospiraceae bacterium]
DMLNLAKEFNLELVDLLKDQQDKKLIKDIFFFDDRIISEKQVLREFSKISIKIARDIDSLDENYRNAAAIRLDHLPLSEYFNGLKCAKWLKELLSAAYVAEYGLDCSEQSTLNFLDLINPKTSSGFEVFGDSDERFRIKGGNSKIIEGLERKIGEQRIKKEHLLTEVLEMDNGQYAMIFSNKTVVVADYVVLTLPFTMLRNVKLRLKSISKEKKQCIDELGYGTNTKLVLAYHGTPWNNDLNKAYGYLFHKDITNGWDSSLNKTSESTYGAYVCFFGGKYAEKLHAESFKNPSAPPFHVWKTALPEETVGGIVNELDRIFLQSAKSYTGKHVFVNWIDYPYAKGSYSCFKVGQWTSMSGKALEPTGKVFFTGEHCSKDFMGFMNGAAETGRQVAETIAELLLKK